MNDIIEKTYFGILLEAPVWVTLTGVIIFILVLGYRGAALWLWSLFTLLLLWVLAAPIWLCVVALVILLIFNISFIRKNLVTSPLMNLADKIGFLPSISPTQKIALESGTTWIDGEFLTGKPDFKRIRNEKYALLSEKEKSFIDNQVDEVCAMQSDWELSQKKDLNAEVWEYLKKERFFGMVIPEKYGGHGFSAYGMNSVVTKLASRSVSMSVDVMVPNSLGPAELLLNYGTDEQKDYYLPRLAEGKEIPCFALTEPEAGSDAAGMQSDGEVFADDNGDLFIRLNWNKRYITLAAVSTLLGLAFDLKDPKNLLGKGQNPGITCGLIPTDLPGVRLGRRHNPLNTFFINSPTEGENVIVSVDQIIGGPEQAGKGWKMLMETLAGGRGIFLPAMNTGGAKLAARVTGNFCVVRQQFGLPIGRFEAIEELLSPIGSYAYALDAVSAFTCGGLDEGNKPAVISAIVKYNSSEINRQIVNNAMDILGGIGIILGPKNFMGNAHMAVPIGITVEGSNVVTRSLITFGQGLIRSHPYALEELTALEEKNITRFDKSFWSHMRMIVRNTFRASLLNMTRGYLSGPYNSPVANHYRKLNWASANFAFMSDLILGLLGGGLKKKEKLSGRYADIISWLYISSCVLRKYEADGFPKKDKIFVDWMMAHGLHKIQKSFEGIYRNIPVPVIGGFFKYPMYWWSRLNPLSPKPSDKLGHKVAKAMQFDKETRDKLSDGIFIPKNQEEQLYILEYAYKLSIESKSIYEKIREATKKGIVAKNRTKHLAEEAVEAGAISQDEYEHLKELEVWREKAMSVDDFDLTQLPVNVYAPQEKPANSKD
ncbi:acyl-CoA dehydrogenase [Psychroflexus salinarum]|uniref:Acyl-coenzyme A dehydrogenase n=1 Tax=Psychroflexus salinarum TaxID=546024 RepID=A0ABW3GR95_9FLAO